MDNRKAELGYLSYPEQRFMERAITVLADREAKPTPEECWAGVLASLILLESTGGSGPGRNFRQMAVLTLWGKLQLDFLLNALRTLWCVGYATALEDLANERVVI